MDTTLTIGYIVSDPAKRGGKPRILGTGITVQNIVEDMALGMTVEQIAEAYDLSLSQVYAALAYYHDHKEYIDAAIVTDQSMPEPSHLIGAISADALRKRIQDKSKRDTLKSSLGAFCWSAGVQVVYPQQKFWFLYQTTRKPIKI